MEEAAGGVGFGGGVGLDRPTAAYGTGAAVRQGMTTALFLLGIPPRAVQTHVHGSMP